MRVAVLTVSDRAARGAYPDGTGPLIERTLVASGAAVVRRALIPDDQPAIEATLVDWCDRGDIDVILTNGGTGLGARDRTPEATLAVITRAVPGIAEAMRLAGMRATPHAALSRQVAGQRGTTLVVNLPGAPKAAAESIQAILDILPHAVEMVSA